MSNTIYFGKRPLTKLISDFNYNLHCILGRNEAAIVFDTDNGLQKNFTIIDECKDESFYCAGFTEQDNQNLLLLAGKIGIIKVCNLKTHRFIKALKGHGHSINDLKVHPIKKNIIFTASTDLSIRMWDLESERILAIFGGMNGHRDVILSIDIDHRRGYVISGSHDHTIKIWKIPEPEDGNIICVNFPSFHSAAIHYSFINTVAFYNNFVICKGEKNQISVFSPSLDGLAQSYEHNSNCLFIESLNLTTPNKLCNNFVIADNKLFVASSDLQGTVFIFDLLKLGENAVFKKISTNQSKNIYQVTANRNYLYVLYTDNYLHKIKFI